jgi:O-antigen/teichoic acid export membrane protein
MSQNDSNARRLIKHSTIYAIGNISRQLIGFIMLPVYTRYLTPADYGVIGLLTFSVSLIEGVFGARLGQAMPKFYFEQDTQRDRNAVISTALIVTGGISTLMTAILFLTRGTSAELLFGTDRYAAVLGLFCFSILINALESQSLVYLQIQGLPKLFVTINLVKLATQFAFNIFFVVYLKWGVTGIAISSISSSGIFAICLSVFSFVRAGVRYDFPLARRMIVFSWPLWVAGIASLYINSAGRYYIRIFSSLADVGLYELAAKFGGILTLLIAQPFSRFWDTERFNHYRKSNNAEIFRGVFQVYATLLALTALAISLFGAYHGRPGIPRCLPRRPIHRAERTHSLPHRLLQLQFPGHRENRVDHQEFLRHGRADHGPLPGLHTPAGVRGSLHRAAGGGSGPIPVHATRSPKTLRHADPAGAAGCDSGHCRRRLRGGRRHSQATEPHV